MAALDNLPPEMQQRIAAIMAGAPANQPESPHQAAIATPPAPPAPAPVVKPPSLIDHMIALRTEVAELRQQNAAVMQTTEAVGAAVAQIYEMFQPAQGQTYSEQFTQESPQYQEDY